MSFTQNCEQSRMLIYKGAMSICMWIKIFFKLLGKMCMRNTRSPVRLKNIWTWTSINDLDPSCWPCHSTWPYIKKDLIYIHTANGFLLYTCSWEIVWKLTDKTRIRPEYQTRGHDNLSQRYLTYQKEVLPYNKGYKISLKKK